MKKRKKLNYLSMSRDALIHEIVTLERQLKRKARPAKRVSRDAIVRALYDRLDSRYVSAGHVVPARIDACVQDALDIAGELHEVINPGVPVGRLIYKNDIAPIIEEINKLVAEMRKYKLAGKNLKLDSLRIFRGVLKK